MINCNEMSKSERQRILQMADVRRAMRSLVWFDREVERPHYVKTEFRWKAMVRSRMMGNTEPDND